VNIANDRDILATGWLKGLLLTALCFSIGTFLVNQIYDLDVWWQVAIGRDILAHGSVPAIDRFAAAAQGRPYHDSHWLFQLLLAAADRIGGMTGVQLVMVALWTAILGCVGRAASRWVAPVYWMPLLFLAAMASTERFLPRPELVTFLGVAFFYWRLQEGCYRSWKDQLLLLLMQLVWVNGHGLFVLGPFLIGCYWLMAVVGRSGESRAALPSLSRLLALSVGVTLVTPYGWENWRYALLLFQEAGPKAPKLLKSVGELSPTFGAATMSGVAFWFFLALLLVVTLAGGWALLRKNPVSAPRLLIVAVMLAAALTGRRNMVLFALVAVPFAAEQLHRLPPMSRRVEQSLAVAAAALMLLWSWYPLSGNYYLRMELPSRTGFGATPSFFPHGLAAFLEKIDYRGQVFNSNTLGGFYLYHRYPAQVAFTDGRWEVYAAGTFDEINRSLGSAAAWEAFAGRQGITGILLQHASSEARTLLLVLRGNPRWRLVYLDAAASFWVGADAYRTVPTVVPAGLPELPAAPRLDDCLILDRFYQQMGLDAPRVRNLERALTFGRATDALLASLGTTLVTRERYPEALAVFERLHREYPRNITALNELAFLAYRQGDPVRAEELLRQALELEPDNADARANYQRVRDFRKSGRN
jgi:tetratricopeptide (TPR) repeat protein